MFEDQRKKAAALLTEVHRDIVNLNESIAKRSCAVDTARLRADRILRHHGVANAFEIDVDKANGVPVVRITLNEDNWTRRRRFDGCCLLVGHLDLDGPPEHLIALYRSRNTIEEGFRTIKSVTELRPVHHRTDLKVRAHVSLCALALLLRRLLALHLLEAGIDVSESTALDLFAACHLNRVSTARGKTHTHTVTTLDEETHTLVDKLGYKSLIDDDHVIGRIVPR
jgi:transposase